MKETRIEAKPDGSVTVIGVLDHRTVPSLLKTSNEVLFKGAAQGGDLAIDLAQVNRSDSAGVALLIEWLRQAKKAGCNVRFNHMPAQMRELAVVGGVDKLLAQQPM